MIMSRYKVTQLPDQSVWVILDRELYSYCMLPDGEGNLIPLEWRAREGAEAWLSDCRRIWQAGVVPAPHGYVWHNSPEVSPWDQAWYDR